MSLEVDEVTVSFGTRRVLERVGLVVPSGSVTALLGPSGSGKSTLLRVIAGLLTPDTGRVSIDGVDVTRWPTHRRQVGMVFQDEQLFPHLDVARNIAFGLEVAGESPDAIRRRVAELLELVDLAAFAERRVTDLSGGEAKRVALARALAPRPAVLLLDEPLTGLDTDLHDRLVIDLRRILTTEGTTALHVTHDATEASRVADVVTALHRLQPAKRPST